MKVISAVSGGRRRERRGGHVLELIVRKVSQPGLCFLLPRVALSIERMNVFNSSPDGKLSVSNQTPVQN